MRKERPNDRHRQEMEMNSYIVYLSARGIRFDPDKFNNHLPRALRGHVKNSYRMIAGNKMVVGRFWVSKEVRSRSSLSAEKCLAGLLVRYRPWLRKVAKNRSTKIIASAVYQVEDLTRVGGMYLSKEKVALLQDCGAELDLSIYPR